MIGRWCNRKEWKPSDVFFTFSSSFMLVVAIYQKGKSKKETGKPVFHEKFSTVHQEFIIKVIPKIEITQ